MFETGINLADLTFIQDLIAHTLVIGYGNAGDTITLKDWDPDGVFGTSVIQNIVVADWKNDPNPTGVGFTLASFLPSLSGFVNGTNAGNSFANHTITSGPTDDFIEGGADGMTLNAGAGNDTISGGDGNDTLHGGTGDNQLFGGGGSDLIYAEGASDTIDGGTGNDTLIGIGGGTYTYLFGPGGGQDVIDGSGGGQYVVQLSGSVTSDDVTVGRSGSNLILGLPGGQDSLTLQSFATNPSLVVRLPDGTVWDQNTLPLPGGVVTGTNGNDTILTGATNDLVTGGAGDDFIDAGPGNDTVNGGDGNDSIHGGIGNNQLIGGTGDDQIFSQGTSDTTDGGAGNDIIFADGANDTIDGGLGNDTLTGTGGGNFTYLFGVGGGQDVIDGRQGGNYVVQLSANLIPGDVAVGRSGQDLILILPGGQDSLTLQSFYTNPSVKWHSPMARFGIRTRCMRKRMQRRPGPTAPISLTGYRGFSNTLAGGGGMIAILSIIHRTPSWKALKEAMTGSPAP